MFKNRVYLLLLLSFTLFCCTSVPFTGRSQLNLIPESTMLSMSYQQYSNFLGSHQVVINTRQAGMVKSVGSNLSKAVGQYFKSKGMGSELRNFDWEFTLIQSDQVNAWCMPGGKIAVYTGILPLTSTETGLAVVLGHEIGHAVAKHGNERMSQMLLTQLGGVALAQALESQPKKTRNLWLSAFGIGAQVGILLPYSRTHEYEADYLGLLFMAMAGYNPNEAIFFWQRMIQQSGGSSMPEFLSTHPASSSRIKEMKKHLPEAMTFYNNGRKF